MAGRFVLFLVLTTRVWACSCTGPWLSVKQAWQGASVVFSGTVEVADPDVDATQAEFEQQFVRIRVEKGFKAISAGEKVELRQGATDCDAKFRTGQRAVFYLQAGTTPSSFFVPWCSKALGDAEPGGDDLLFLEALPKSSIGTRLSGEVEFYQDTPAEAFKKIRGVPNIRVKIVGPLGFTRNIVTNSAGAYQAFGLKPGRYSLSITVPKGMVDGSPGQTDSSRMQEQVDLAPDGGVSANFVLRDDTRVSGRIIDAKGEPLKDVCLNLEPLAGRSENGGRFFACSQAGGDFEVMRMPPGKYLLVARDKVNAGLFKSESTLYYPGVRERERAGLVSVGAGKHLAGLDIRLPPDEKRYKLTGRLQFSDGAPVANARVTFTSAQHGYTETTQTAADGSFGMSVIAGMSGQLASSLGVWRFLMPRCPDLKLGSRRAGLLGFIDADPIAISGTGDYEGLQLQLQSPSCAALLPH